MIAFPELRLPSAVSRALIAASVILLGGVLAGAAASLAKPGVGLIAVAALFVVVIALLRPTGRFWMLAAIITLLPFAVIPVRLGAQPTMLDATLALLMAILLLRFLSRAQKGVSTPMDLPVLVYAGLCCVAFIFGTAYGVNGETARYFLKILFAILLFFAVTNGLTRRWMLSSFVQALTLGSFASALLAVALSLAGQNTAMRVLSALGPLGYPTGADTLRFIAGTSIWRATSTSDDPNIFGGLLMVGIVLLVGSQLGGKAGYLFARSSKAGKASSSPDEGATGAPEASAALLSMPFWQRRAVALPMLAIMLWALLISYSRGAYVGMAAGIVFLAVIRYRKLLLPMGVIALVLALTLSRTTFGSHLISGFLVEDKAAAMRLGEYKDAVTFISEYPVFGVGFGTTPSGSAVTPNIDIYVGVSNIYLLMTLEIGFVGMAGFVAAIGTLLIWAWKRYKIADETGQVWIATCTAALAAAAVAGIADHYFFRFPHMVALFWSLIGCIAVASRLGPGESSEGQDRSLAS